MAEFAIRTDRLILREWRDEDHAPLLALCSNPRVMEHLGPLQDAGEVAAAIARQRASQRERNCCFWAVERRADGAMLGFCGVRTGFGGTPLDRRPEIGWRLCVDAWGQGYAREAAQASLDHVWAHSDEPEVFAMTVPANRRSWGLMERLGMVRRDDMAFEHPALPAGNPLRTHIVYSIARPA